MAYEFTFPNQEDVERTTFKILSHYGIDLYDDVQKLKAEMPNIVKRYEIYDVDIAVSLAESNSQMDLIRDVFHVVWELESYKLNRKRRK